MPEKTNLVVLAPCAVVAGPANSGKTAFLHQVNEVLQHHASRPMVYVVKGSPDGTGRFLYYSPELRKELQERLNGAWTPQAVETISSWVLNAVR